MTTHQQLAGFIWQVADLLRGDYKRSEYGKVILPFTVLRRLECVLEPTKAEVLKRKAELDAQGAKSPSPAFFKKATGGLSFVNTSKLVSLKQVAKSPDDVHANLLNYLGGFSKNAADIFESYDILTQIERLDKADLLYPVVTAFADDKLDLSPATVGNQQMGYLFEELIRRFSELSNETAGEHFTPREVVKLMVRLLLAPDEQELTVPGKVFSVLDPACGTGGMLTGAEEFIQDHNPGAHVELFGQELNPESYAICRSDMMIKGEQADNIRFGNSFSHDRFYGQHFDYLLANPPFGVEWKKVKDEVEHEHEQLEWKGRFGAGLPRINDGSFLFLQHMVHHMRPPADGGSRMAIVFNGSPLFTGAAGSGESEIRRWLLENDLVEGIIGLPEQLFYNTGISTYFWILTNRKKPEAQGKVVLLDAREHWAKMRKSLGDKRRYITGDQIDELTSLYVNATSVAADEDHPAHAKVKIFENQDFGYQRITVERPLVLRFEVTEDALAELDVSKPLAKYRQRAELLAALRTLIEGGPSMKRADFAACLETALIGSSVSKLPAPVDKAVWSAVSISDTHGEVQLDARGGPVADPGLRDNESVPLGESVEAFFAREVLPHVPDAWLDGAKTKLGFELAFTRNFYVASRPRPVSVVEDEISKVQDQIRLIEERSRTNVWTFLAGIESNDRKSCKVPWLNTIPDHWREVRINYVARMGSGHTPSRSRPELWLDCVVPWVTTGEVSGLRDDRREIIESTREKISWLGIENSAAQIHPAGTVVLCRTAASAGYSAVMGANMATSQDFATWTCSAQLDPFFLLWCLRAMRGDLLERLAFGSTHKTIYFPDLQSLMIPLPPMDEQRKVVESIRQVNAATWDLTDSMRERVDLLSERRESAVAGLIAANVS